MCLHFAQFIMDSMLLIVHNYYFESLCEYLLYFWPIHIFSLKLTRSILRK